MKQPDKIKNYVESEMKGVKNGMTYNLSDIEQIVRKAFMDGIKVGINHICRDYTIDAFGNFPKGTNTSNLNNSLSSEEIFKTDFL